MVVTLGKIAKTQTEVKREINLNKHPMPTVQIKGKNVLIDECDLPLISRFSWRIAAGRAGGFYVVRSSLKADNLGYKTQIGLHREILQPCGDSVVDHINGNPLDNRRCNLRVCLPSQNLQNRRVYRARAGTFKGLNFRKNAVAAQITFRGRVIYLGDYQSEIAAARAYDAAARVFFGEFSCLNFPTEQISLDAVNPNHRHKLNREAFNIAA